MAVRRVHVDDILRERTEGRSHHLEEVLVALVLAGGGELVAVERRATARHVCGQPPPLQRREEAAGEGTAGDAAAGEAVFSGNCAACHAGGQNVIMPEKTLEKAALEEYLDGGFNEKAVMKQVTNGKNAMPAFGGRLSDDDIANVAAYVISTSSAGWE